MSNWRMLIMSGANKLDKKVANAVAHFWRTRQKQFEKQQVGDKKDQGGRSAVTGGAQMDGFVELIPHNLLAFPAPIC